MTILKYAFVFMAFGLATNFSFAQYDNARDNDLDGLQSFVSAVQECVSRGCHCNSSSVPEICYSAPEPCCARDSENRQSQGDSISDFLRTLSQPSNQAQVPPSEAGRCSYVDRNPPNPVRIQGFSRPICHAFVRCQGPRSLTGRESRPVLRAVMCYPNQNGRCGLAPECAVSPMPLPDAAPVRGSTQPPARRVPAH